MSAVIIDIQAEEYIYLCVTLILDVFEDIFMPDLHIFSIINMQ